ncbi:MAG TPA: amino acid ABC transporter substrate-binding protein, partial [Sediminispirochaeta sp.]|nr:amino acid ABC transporter substrate-binding protein [Sediminispirochaeta sp.]
MIGLTVGGRTIRLIKLRTATVLIILLLVPFFSCRDDGVKLGFSSQLSGPGGTPNTIVRNGFVLFIDQYNREAERRIELLVRDDMGRADKALEIDRELVQAGVEAIVGHTTSEMSAASLDFINGEKVVMLSPTSSAQNLMERDDYFFTLYPSNEVLAGKAADFAYQKLGLRRIAAVVDNFNRLYSENYFQQFQTEFEARGGRIISKYEYNSEEDNSFEEIAAEALASDPDGVFIMAASLDTALFAQQLYKERRAVPIVASDWAAYRELIEQGGPYVENIYLANLYADFQPGDEYSRFLDDYFGRYNRRATMGAAIGFETAMVISQALERRKPGEDLK